MPLVRFYFKTPTRTSEQKLGFSPSLMAYMNEILITIIKEHLEVKTYEVFGAGGLGILVTSLHLPKKPIILPSGDGLLMYGAP